jgi:PAS domain S-box-containing protein
MAGAGPPPAPPAPALEIYRSLFVAYPDALLLVDPQGVIVLANPQAAQLLGYAEAELAGLSVDVLVPAAIRPRHAAYRQAYGQQPRARPMGTQMELVARRRDGTEVMVEIALSPLQDQGLPYVVAAVRGIDSYPRVQQALRRARYSECLAQVARLAVDEPDLQVMLQRVPASVAEVVGADSATLLLLEPGGAELRVVGGAQLLPGEALGMKLPNTAESLAGHAVHTAMAVTVPDFAAQTRFVVPRPAHDHGLRSGLAMPLVNREQVIGVLELRCRGPRQFAPDDMQFMESIASLLANRLQRAQSEEALEHVQRLETVGQLTGGIAHDFNNLLTIIQGNLQVLEDRPSIQADAPAAECLAAALRASYRSAELTHKLLAFSRRQALSPRLLDVPALLFDLATLLRRTLDRSIDVQLDTQPLGCVADAAQLESALLNLAVNARDAMPGGGVLRLSCRPLAEPSGDLAAELAAGLSEGRGYGVIEVSDSGTGMSAEVIKRAFEPFFTTKALGRGTGLGLSSVFGFVKQSQGTVRLQSAPGLGTTVMLVLPGGHGVAAAQGADALRGSPAALPAGLQVLLVEDEAEVRQSVSHTLRALGCSVTELEDAEQALVYLEGNPAPQLLLSDVALGAGMPGTELADRVGTLRPAMARLLMSGYMSDAYNEARASATGVELLRKPFDRAALLAAIRRALAAAGVNAAPPAPAD